MAIVSLLREGMTEEILQAVVGDLGEDMSEPKYGVHRGRLLSRRLEQREHVDVRLPLSGSALMLNSNTGPLE
jgi:hypothetical protein